MGVMNFLNMLTGAMHDYVLLECYQGRNCKIGPPRYIVVMIFFENTILMSIYENDINFEYSSFIYIFSGIRYHK